MGKFVGFSLAGRHKLSLSRQPLFSFSCCSFFFLECIVTDFEAVWRRAALAWHRCSALCGSRRVLCRGPLPQMVRRVAHKAVAELASLCFGCRAHLRISMWSPEKVG